MIIATLSQTFRTLRLLKTLVVVPILAAGSLAMAGGAMPEMAELSVQAASAYRTIRSNVDDEAAADAAKAPMEERTRPLSPAVLVASTPRPRPAASEGVHRGIAAGDRRRSEGSMLWLPGRTGG